MAKISDLLIIIVFDFSHGVLWGWRPFLCHQTKKMSPWDIMQEIPSTAINVSLPFLCPSVFQKQPFLWLHVLFVFKFFWTCNYFADILVSLFVFHLVAVVSHGFLEHQHRAIRWDWPSSFIDRPTRTFMLWAFDSLINFEIFAVIDSSI